MDFCPDAGVHQLVPAFVPQVAASVVGSLPGIVLAGEQRRRDGSARELWPRKESSSSSDDVMA